MTYRGDSEEATMLLEVRVSTDGQVAMLFEPVTQRVTDGRHWMSLAWREDSDMTMSRYTDDEVAGWSVVYRKDVTS